MNICDLSMSVYVANLKKRTDRLAHIKEQFEGKDEFEVHYIEAIEDKIGDLGLWKTFCKCIGQAKELNEDVIIFCEDDHEFTECYTRELLFKNIFKAYQLQADLLIGGSTGGFSVAVPISKNLIWVNDYWSNQFLVIYEKFFDVILGVNDFDPAKKVDNTLSKLALNKFVLFPYISRQKNFGYSDVTSYNNINPDEVAHRFENTEKRLRSINTIYNLFHPDSE